MCSRAAGCFPLTVSHLPVKRRGFTLIELTVVIAVLLVLASAVIPNLVAFENSQRERSFLNGLMNLAAQGREKAIAQGKAVDLEYDDSANQFKLHTTDDNGNDQTVTTFDIMSGFQVGRVVLGDSDSSPTDWKLNFYPNGTSDGGGVEMTMPDSSPLSLKIDKNGHAQLLNDRLPDTSNDKWQAGDYVHRTG